ncbi:MAG: preprotein translocase subunit SecE [Bacilli bacterium]|nr:preprotein translocase subunit SecE [Bacilli bacterium]MDD4607847.1 preprotein translocase subunit SecE [Bacilli bacterium]
MKKVGKFFIGVKKELAKVRWPSKKEMTKYSIATISFIIFFGAFFALIDFILAGIKVLIG